MAVAGGWTDPSTTSLGTTYKYEREMNGVNFTVTAQTNDKRVTYISIMASATASDKKTGKTTDMAVRNFMKNHLLPLINNNAGTGSEVF